MDRQKNKKKKIALLLLRFSGQLIFFFFLFFKSLDQKILKKKKKVFFVLDGAYCSVWAILATYRKKKKKWRKNAKKAPFENAKKLNDLISNVVIDRSKV